MCVCVCFGGLCVRGGCYLNWVDGGDDDDGGGGEADYLGAVRDMDFSSLSPECVENRPRRCRR